MYRALPLLAGLVVLLCAGCKTPPATGRPRVRLVEGERAYRAGQYELAVQRLSEFIDQAGGDPAVPRALYVRGMARAQTAGRPAAYGDLARAAREARDPQIVWSAQAVLGVLHFEDGQWDAAASALAAAVDRMPSVAPRDALLYRLGLCRERTGRWREAEAAYRAILSGFPRGPYAEQAQRRLELQADHFSVQCGVFADRRNAEALARELSAAGLDAHVRPETRAGQACHVVLVGRHATYEAALDALAQVKGHVPGAVLWP